MDKSITTFDKTIILFYHPYFQLPTQRKRSSTTGCQEVNQLVLRAISRCHNLISRRLLQENWTSRDMNQVRYEPRSTDWWEENVFKLDPSLSCKLCFCSRGTQDTFLFRFVQNTRYNLPLINTSMHLLHDVTTCYWKLNLVVSGVSSLCSDCCPILGRILAQQRGNLRPCDIGWVKLFIESK